MLDDVVAGMPTRDVAAKYGIMERTVYRRVQTERNSRRESCQS
jgi:transposase